MRWIWIATIVTMAASPCLADRKEAPTLWFGDVTYSHTITSSWAGVNKQPNSTASLSSNRNAHIWTHIHFCVGGPERFAHAKGQFGYRDVAFDNREYSQDHKMCKGEKQEGNWQVRPERVTPGDSENITETKSTVAVHDEKTTGYNEWGNYRVTWMPGDSALSFGVIMPFVDIVIRTTIERESGGRDACAGEDLPGSEDPKPLEMGRRLSVPIIMDEPRMTYFKRKILKDISGEEGAKGHRPNWKHIPSGKITGFYTEREIETWYMTSDACEYVKSHMSNAKKLKDLFEQVVAESSGMSSADAQRLMDEKLSRVTGGSIFSPMQTQGSTCRVIPAEADNFRPLEEIRERYFKCLPDVVFESDLLHERVHQKSCASAGQNDCSFGGIGKTGQQLVGECRNGTKYQDWIDDPRNRANEEVAAYQAQYNHLKKWVDEHCADD